jgi:hypothetical protein
MAAAAAWLFRESAPEVEDATFNRMVFNSSGWDGCGDQKSSVGATL